MKLQVTWSGIWWPLFRFWWMYRGWMWACGPVNITWYGSPESENVTHE